MSPNKLVDQRVILIGRVGRGLKHRLLLSRPLIGIPTPLRTLNVPVDRPHGAANAAHDLSCRNHVFPHAAR